MSACADDMPLHHWQGMGYRGHAHILNKSYVTTENDLTKYYCCRQWTSYR